MRLAQSRRDSARFRPGQLFRRQSRSSIAIIGRPRARTLCSIRRKARPLRQDAELSEGGQESHRQARHRGASLHKGSTSEALLKTSLAGNEIVYLMDHELYV